MLILSYQKEKLCPYHVTPYNLLSLYHASNSLSGSEENAPSNYRFPNPTHIHISGQQFLCHLTKIFSSFNKLTVAR